MSAPTLSPPTSAAASASQAIPPYAGPVHVSSEWSAGARVGPFVPAAHREVAPWHQAAGAAGAIPSPLTTVAAAPSTATPVVASIALPTPAVASPVLHAGTSALAVPPSIPPYRPLRPSPIISPATRSPLYIPPIATPAGERVVEDEGVIEPQIIHTAEFEVPQTETGAPAPTPSVATVDDEVPAAAPAGDLPWIDAFLASTPALPMPAVDETAAVRTMESRADSTPDASIFAPFAVPVETPGDGSASMAPIPVDADGAADEWPLEEAAEEFRALRSAMDGQAAPDVPASEFAEATGSAAVAPLSEWRDDDLMDVLPIRHSGRTPLSTVAIGNDGEPWAERAGKAHDEAQVFRAMASTPAAAPRAETDSRAEPPNVGATAEEAAHALELLARRVRAGELMLPSYDPRMGEPAALVAALAALLGVKLR